jgi:hypothetical protein
MNKINNTKKIFFSNGEEKEEKKQKEKEKKRKEKKTKIRKAQNSKIYVIFG